MSAKTRMVGWMVLALGLAGCVTVEPVAAVPDEPAAMGSFSARAVCIGLTKVDAAAYGGWDGACPGADVDMRKLADYFIGGGVPTVTLYNAAATVENVKAEITAAADGLADGDALIVTTSGHGGYVPDENGDEASGMDSTLCLWDRQWVDDEVLEHLSGIRKKLRIYIITDNCHAEGNFRVFARVVQRAVSGGRWGAMPRFEMDRKAENPLWTVCQLAGSREAAYSFGTTNGGTWSLALLANPKKGWKAWYDAAAGAMPASQRPVWVEFGTVTEETRNAPVFPVAGNERSPK